MSNFVIYGHFGSHNHGNEAIVRGLKNILGKVEVVLYSYNIEMDIKFELNDICEVRPFFRRYRRYSFHHIVAALSARLKLRNNQFLFKNYRLKQFFQNLNGVYMLEAGDQYCENYEIKNFYAYVNKKIVNKGVKTVMLPCTIIEKDFDNKKLIEDLKRYSLIFARESCTYNALIKAGFSDVVHFAPDPAFVMEPKQVKLPNLFTKNSIVGLTIGMLAQGKEEYTEKVIENSKNLIKYIIYNTDFSVALIPHVNVSDNLTDITSMRILYNEFKDTGRIVEISEKRADEQKYIISQCRFMVTLRTHASISAYSSGVPTLVIGYSQKSKGIAMDLFETSENYVINVESLNNKNCLTNSFIWLVENEDMIKQKLSKVLPLYLEKMEVINNELMKISGKCNV